MKFTTHRLILPGVGYWDTTKHPIGGNFQRAPSDGLSVAVQRTIHPAQKGCNEVGLTDDGRTVCYDKAQTRMIGEKPECNLPPSGDSDDGRSGRYEE